MAQKLLTTLAFIFIPLIAGYACRKLRLVPEIVAAWLMTAVVVGGYSTVGLLSIWKLDLHPADAWLPVLGSVQMLLMAGLAALVAGRLTRDRGEQGLFIISCGVGNNGLTMAGFICYILYGAQGLGLTNIYCLGFSIMVVALSYPVARHFSSELPGGSLSRLLKRSIFDWRSLGMPLAVAGIVLSAARVPQPQMLDDWHVLDILVFAVNAAAYFAVGLRMRVSYVPSLKRLIAALAVMRFPVGAAVGVGLCALAMLTPWPLHRVPANVFIIEAFVSMAVTNVAVANMFDLRPREASALFVTNTILYLLLVLPIVLWVFKAT